MSPTATPRARRAFAGDDIEATIINCTFTDAPETFRHLDVSGEGVKTGQDGLIESPVVRELLIRTPGPGLHEITGDVARVVGEAGLAEGLCTIFIRHTSASLVIQENADPSARRDLEAWFARIAPAGDPLYTHTSEGPDDMPSHVRAALTQTSLGIPVIGGGLGLGTWQGVYLFEHRDRGHARRVLVRVGG